MKEIYKRVVDVAEGAAKMTGTEMTYELYAGLSDYIPNHVLSEGSPRVHGGDRCPEIRRGGLCLGIKILP